ncbi:MAG: hypothetical protein UR26_C0005G0052 [candidate division TM6 bacterium GW2011_GWF2_32_72]|nr:MAG: hypothetical protein UR26_C0005G0052 [candidate division TM6 bacterium GW2011_GWF2_32_72]
MIVAMKNQFHLKVFFLNFKTLGTSLIECLVFLAAVSIFSIILFRSYSLIQSRFKECGIASNRISTLLTAITVLERDLYAAPFEISQWSQQSSGEYVFKLKDVDICWEKQGDSVFRIYGQFDRKNHKWLKRKRDPIMNNVESFLLNIDKQEDPLFVEIVKSVNFKIKSKNMDIDRLVALRNRIIYV